MVYFEQFISRHSEAAAQAVIENLERFKGIRRDKTLSLEERWHHVMSDAAEQKLAA